MGNVELTVLLLLVVGAFAWIVVRVLRGSEAGGESSARADTLGTGAGIVAEQMDNVRNFDR
jgi:hypothetical protein